MFDTRNRKKLGKIQARYDTQYHRVINNQPSRLPSTAGARIKKSCSKIN